MKRKAIATMILASTLMLNCMPAMAATNLDNSKTTLNKVLNVDEGATVPGVTFNFTIAPGTGVKADGNEIYAGVAGATISNATFTQGQTTTENKATSNITLDFSGCDFKGAGIYRYVITESEGNSTNNTDAFTNDTNTTRYVDVYVENTDDGGLKVAGYVIYSALPQGTEDEDALAALKSTGYENTFNTVDLGIKNATEGNQADKTKQFDYTVKLDDGIPGSTYTITIYDKDGNVKETGTITIDENGDATYDFTLADGEYAEIPEIATGTKYSVTADKDGYDQTKEDVENYEDTVSGTLSEDKDTSYTHKKEGTIPTGVVMTIAPFAGVALAGAAGVILKSKKKREDDEE